jgi:hypothetical protein
MGLPGASKLPQPTSEQEQEVKYVVTNGVFWLRALPRPEVSSGFVSEALSSITGFYTWECSSLLVKEYQYIRILFELSTKLLSNG